MVQRRILQGHSSCDTHVWQRCRGDYRPRLAWSALVGWVTLLVLSLAWTGQGIAGTGSVGFLQECSGFAHDPLLGPLWPERPGPGIERDAMTLAAMVPRLSLHGTALATYGTQAGPPTAPTLERVFGVIPGSQRQIVETTFRQEAQAVVLHPQILATVAHALTPAVVEVHVPPHTRVQTVPLRVTNMTIAAQTMPGDEEVLARVAHMNEPYDLALVQADASQLLHSLPFPAVLSYGTGDPNKPIGGLEAGDCVAAIISSRHGEVQNNRVNRLIVGKVLARVPVATNSLTQTKLNVNMFTTDLAVQPGDSGSPVLAIQAGKPVLVGLISATMYPTALFTYVSRIDPLLALADALRLALSPARVNADVAARPDKSGNQAITR
jgi:Trypsin-like peptidase domain